MLWKCFAVHTILSTVADKLSEMRGLIVLGTDWNKAKRELTFLQPAVSVTNTQIGSLYVLISVTIFSFQRMMNLYCSVGFSPDSDLILIANFMLTTLQKYKLFLFSKIFMVTTSIDLFFQIFEKELHLNIILSNIRDIISTYFFENWSSTGAFWKYTPFFSSDSW